MKKGEYITDRLLPAFVKASAEKRGIDCTDMSDGWAIRLTQGLKIRWVLGYQFDVNTAAASALAQDKVATFTALQHARVPAVEHLLVRSLLGEPFPVDRLRKEFKGPFVLKPLDGSGGRDVRKVADAAEAEQFAQRTGELTWAASPLYDIKAEFRVVLLDGQPLVIYEKTQPKTEHGLLYYNLGKGAVPVHVVREDGRGLLEALARQTCSALGLRLASVDIVRINDTLRVLEVNDGIMMENYARYSDEYRHTAGLVYDAIVATMFA